MADQVVANSSIGIADLSRTPDGNQAALAGPPAPAGKAAADMAAVVPGSRPTGSSVEATGPATPENVMKDPQFVRAVELCIEKGRCGPKLVRDELAIRVQDAQRIIDQMMGLGVAAKSPGGTLQLVLTREQWDAMRASSAGDGGSQRGVKGDDLPAAGTRPPELDRGTDERPPHPYRGNQAAPAARTELAMNDITLDPSFHGRKHIDPEVVDTYAELIDKGRMDAEVSVMFDGTRYLLVDGFHTYGAKQKLGHTHITARVYRGGREEAILFAAAANARHGLPRTNEDKKRAVLMVVTVCDDWCNSTIAGWVGVTDKTVEKYRPPEQSGNSEGGRKFKTKDGSVRSRKAKNAARRHRSAAGAASSPRASAAPSADPALPADRRDSVVHTGFDGESDAAVEASTFHRTLSVDPQVDPGTGSVDLPEVVTTLNRLWKDVEDALAFHHEQLDEFEAVPLSDLAAKLRELSDRFEKNVAARGGGRAGKAP